MYLVMVQNSLTGRRRTMYSYEPLVVGETICHGMQDDMESLAYWDVLECTKIQRGPTTKKDHMRMARQASRLKCTIQK